MEEGDSCLIDTGYCSNGGCSCDGESLVCFLNPDAGQQTEFSFDYGGVVPLPNRKCCHFKVLHRTREGV